MAYQSAYRSHYRRHRRRRNSHWGVLIALILAVVVAVAAVFYIVKGVTGALFGGGKDQIVFQLDSTAAIKDGEVIDLTGAAPFKDESGNIYIPAQSLCDNLGYTFTWDQKGKTATVKDKKTTVTAQVGSKTLRVNEEDKTMAAAPRFTDNTVYVPAKDFSENLSLQVAELGTDRGDLIIVAKSKKELDDKKIGEIADGAISKLGPSRQQVEQTSVIMRVGSDKLLKDGQAVQLVPTGKTLGAGVVEQDGLRYIPLEGAVKALGGSAEFDGKSEWKVSCEGIDSEVSDSGKAKVGGERVKGGNIKAYTDDNGSFYVSAPLFAALIGREYTALASEEGAFAFTKGSLDGFDDRKAELLKMTGGLTDAIGGNIPEADVYVALTFDDGPTGRSDTYPEGYTATLLDELKKRNVHATFFMCGYRVKEVNSHMKRYLEEGHELGNHTMTHPMQRLTHMDAAGVHEEVESNSVLIESHTGHRPTVMRPVGGGVNDTVKQQMKELGLPIINWSVDTLDWDTKKDPESVKRHIVDEVQDGDIVLMHDIWPGTLPGVLAAIDELQSRTDKTYAFVTVSELAAIKGITLEPGVVYTGLREETVQAIKDGTYKERIFD